MSMDETAAVDSGRRPSTVSFSSSASQATLSSSTRNASSSVEASSMSCVSSVLKEAGLFLFTNLLFTTLASALLVLLMLRFFLKPFCASLGFLSFFIHDTISTKRNPLLLLHTKTTSFVGWNDDLVFVKIGSCKESFELKGNEKAKRSKSVLCVRHLQLLPPSRSLTMISSCHTP